jgi:hypothetical protein
MRGELIDNAGGGNILTFFALPCSKSLLQDGMSVTVMVHPAEIVVLGMVRLGRRSYNFGASSNSSSMYSWLASLP